MKLFHTILSLTVLLTIAMPMSVFSQGYGGELNIHGLDNNTLHSATSRAMGGVTLGVRGDIGVMFSNPATLISLERSQVSFGGLKTSYALKQEQHYAPVRYYSNFSLLMENLTHLIPDPATGGTTQADTVQRPYDNVSPNWSQDNDQTDMLQGIIAAPFSIGALKFVVGAGAVQYADLNHYYQNNNVLTPGILSQRPIPVFRPTDNQPLDVHWTQYLRTREGILRGYGVALSGGESEGNFSFGVSALFISGSTEDLVQQISRGRLTFYANSFRLDSTFGVARSKGTSDYSGTEVTVSTLYRTKNVSIGVSAKLPTTLTRMFTTKVIAKTSPFDNELPREENGEDNIQLPWRGTVALALNPRENLILGLEYEIRSYSSAVYTSATGVESSPWLSASVFHVGAEYLPLPGLALRGGIRGQAEVFQPDGNPLEGQPVTFSVYSAGVGIAEFGLKINLTYEYSVMKYQDVWGSAISMNSRKRNSLIADIVYEFQ